MEVKAVGKYVRVQPRKVRILADEVRGTNALKAAALLRFHTSKGAAALRKVLISAIANAQENAQLSPEQLRISTIMVDEGPRLKRMRARAMGRGNKILKKTSHITVGVEDYDVEAKVKPHGTKAKPRPTLSGGRTKKTGPVAAEAPVAPVEPAVEEPTVEEVVVQEVAVETSAVETAPAAVEGEAK